MQTAESVLIDFCPQTAMNRLAAAKGLEVRFKATQRATSIPGSKENREFRFYVVGLAGVKSHDSCIPSHCGFQRPNHGWRNNPAETNGWQMAAQQPI